MFGIAFDLGTTTVVATLLDLSTGTPVAVRSMLNRQQPFGADVIRRISATMLDPTVLPKLQDLAQETLAELAARGAASRASVAPDEVYEVALAGNATMTQLAARHRPRAARRRAVHHGARRATRSCAHPTSASPCTRARTRTSSRRSAPTSAATSSRACWPSGMTRDKRLRLFIDVGTNCEIVLGNAERLLTTAAPAGPAFEAAQIRCGMRAADGAIETVAHRRTTRSSSA